MRLPHLFIIYLILQGCSPDKSFNEDKPIKYSYINYQIELVSDVLITADTTEYLLSVSDSIYSLKYIYQKDSQESDTVSYILKQSPDFQPKYLINRKRVEPQAFVYVANQGFRINDKIYPVYKYASNPYVTDGCVTHFWTPELGIILTRSSTWRSFRKLQTNADRINRQINLLSEVIFQDVSFYNGCDQEMELISKADSEEYYREKYKDWDEVIE